MSSHLPVKGTKGAGEESMKQEVPTGLLVPATMIAVTSDANPTDRAQALLEFAAACGDGDRGAATLALRRAIDAIGGGADDNGDRSLAAAALEVAEEAEAIGESELAAEAYEAGLAASGGRPGGSVCARLWLGLSGHREVEEDHSGALDCLRKMVESQQVDAGEVDRLRGLRRLVEAERRWGLEEECRRAIREGLGLVEGAMSSEAGAFPALWQAAHELGRCAEAVEEPELARAVYLQTLELLGARASARISSHMIGVLWFDIGDTWMAQDQGSKALEAYRLSAARRTNRESAEVATLLVDLAGAELAWGSRQAGFTAAAEGAQLVRGLAPKSEQDAELVRELTEVLSDLGESAGAP